MPELSGLFGKPPFDYRESKTLAIQFQTDPDILRRLVCAPLLPNSDGTMFVSVAEFFCSGFGHYYEAHIFTVAKFKRRPVNYGIYLVLDNDAAIGGGREIWGLPKKFGRLTITVKDDAMSATVERGGSTIIEAAMRMAEFGAPEELAGTPEWVAHKLIPSVSLTAPPEVDQLTSTTVTNIDVRAVHKGPATLRCGASPADRCQEIPINNVGGGYFYVSNFALGDGKVLHNYLA